MPRPRKPQLVVGSARKAPPQPNSIEPERLKRLQESRRVLDHGYLTAPAIFSQQFPRNDIRSLLKELILVIIGDFLSEHDKVTLALSCRFFYNFVQWVCQKPIKLIAPACRCILRSYNFFQPSQDKAICEDLVADARLFRVVLRKHFDPNYIYCGGQGKPAMRRVLPLKHFTNKEEYKTCCCIVSLIEWEMEILKEEKMGSPMKQSKRYLRWIKVAQAKLFPDSRSEYRAWYLFHPVYGHVRNWPWTLDVDWTMLCPPYLRKDLAAAFLGV